MFNFLIFLFMYKHFIQKRAYRFRRFCRAKYAAFRSVHLEVCIGHVASYIAEKQLVKSKITNTLVCFVALMCSPLALFADDETDGFDIQNLSEVSVVAVKQQVAGEALHVVSTITAQQLQSFPTTTLNELLDYLPGIDIRTRGANGAQADISMRGGTFDQVLILLNGVNITDVHTGHANLDIPLDLSTVERVEILQGTSVSQFGLSAFSGAINIVTNTTDQRCVKAKVDGGDFGYFAPALDFRYNKNKWRFELSGNYNQSTGYIDNTDYKYGNLYFNAHCADSVTGEWSLQLGGQLKGFGSNSFYSLKYPDQYEATKTIFGALTWQKQIRFLSMESGIFYRRHYDRFELFREGVAEFPTWYTGHNYHVADAAGINFKASFLYDIGKTAVGIEVRDEHIFSNVLGDALDEPKHVAGAADSICYTKSKNRLNINYFAEQTFYAGNFLASIGVSGNYNSMFRNNFACTANVGYTFDTDGAVFVNVSRALRLPTFTDLYYQSATQTANPNLKPEQSMTAEVGAHWGRKGFRVSLNAYYRVGKDLIDWVKAPEEEKWRSVNHTRVDAFGGEVTVGYKYGYWLKNLEVGYAYCQLDKDAGDLLSKYALDYLKHKLTVNVAHGIYKGFGASWQFTFQQREGNYTDKEGTVQNYQPVYLLDGRVYWQNAKLNVYVEASNLIGQRYYDYGGIEQPGRWFKAGIAVNLDVE